MVCRFYQVDSYSSQRIRLRETHDLNCIPDPDDRLHKARFIIAQINAKLPFGYPFEEAFREEPAYANIVDAIAVAENIKCQSDRAKTVEAYRSMAAIFNEFLVKQEWTDMAIGSFQRKHVLAFLDYAVFTRKGGNRTYNNYLERMKAFFKGLKEREYVAHNPFEEFRRKKLSGKQRRAFSKR